mmetsp:Transcript_12022/g.28223  ORF Transcript_12022/g.28223 Transcript_12022/m.28223 type:complete len:105 (+) Transcript_12022:64-378(+)
MKILLVLAFTYSPRCRHNHQHCALCAKKAFSMPSLRHFNSTKQPATSILKAMRRSFFPTIDLPLDDNFDHYFMGMALQQAELAYKSSEVPIGAVSECGQSTEVT